MSIALAEMIAVAIALNETSLERHEGDELNRQSSQGGSEPRDGHDSFPTPSGRDHQIPHLVEDLGLNRRASL